MELLVRWELPRGFDPPAHGRNLPGYRTPQQAGCRIRGKGPSLVPMHPTQLVAPAICIATMPFGACAAHVIPVPPPRVRPLGSRLQGSFPVAIAIELKDPDIIGEPAARWLRAR